MTSWLFEKKRILNAVQHCEIRSNYQTDCCEHFLLFLNDIPILSILYSHVWNCITSCPFSSKPTNFLSCNSVISKLTFKLWPYSRPSNFWWIQTWHPFFRFSYCFINYWEILGPWNISTTVDSDIWSTKLYKLFRYPIL